MNLPREKQPHPRTRLELVPVKDPDHAREVARLVQTDPVSHELFGGFYADATRLPTQLVSLLGSDRCIWLIRVAGEPVGFVDTDHQSGEVAMAFFVAPSHRRTGVARNGIGRVLGLAMWGHDVDYVMEIAPDNIASAAVARTTGFVPSETNAFGDIRWRRRAPQPRGRADDVTRFLDSHGRIDRYPRAGDQRRRLLEWVVQRAIPAGSALSESEVNSALEPFAPGSDTAVLRRYLVDHELLERTASGSTYHRVAG